MFIAFQKIVAEFLQILNLPSLPLLHRPFSALQPSDCSEIGRPLFTTWLVILCKCYFVFLLCSAAWLYSRYIFRIPSYLFPPKCWFAVRVLHFRFDIIANTLIIHFIQTPCIQCWKKRVVKTIGNRRILSLLVQKYHPDRQNFLRILAFFPVFAHI